jgi:hypothetical protein
MLIIPKGNFDEIERKKIMKEILKYHLSGMSAWN